MAPGGRGGRAVPRGGRGGGVASGRRGRGGGSSVRGRLCLRVFIPFELRGRRSAHRWVDCLPYPPRRALTHRRAADPCGTGMTLLYGVARADVARVEHTVGTHQPQPHTQDMDLFRKPRLTGAHAIVVGHPSDDNLVRLLDAGGAELKRVAWYEALPACPSMPVRFL